MSIVVLLPHLIVDFDKIFSINPSQIIRRFNFSRYVVFGIHIVRYILKIIYLEKPKRLVI